MLVCDKYCFFKKIYYNKKILFDNKKGKKNEKI